MKETIQAQPLTSPVRKRTLPAPVRGFSLVEVMVAATFYLVSLAGVLMGIEAARGMYEHQRKMTVALALSESLMEEFLLYQRGDSRIAAGAHGPENYNGNLDLDGAGQYVARWTVTPSVPTANLREITLTITWPEKLAGSRSLVFKTVRP